MATGTRPLATMFCHKELPSNLDHSWSSRLCRKPLHLSTWTGGLGHGLEGQSQPQKSQKKNLKCMHEGVSICGIAERMFFDFMQFRLGI